MVAVVIPTYNEAENLPVLVQRLVSLEIDELGIVVVDDGSPDSTGDVAEEIRAQFNGYFEVIHRTKKTGLGRAYVAGFLRALESGATKVVQMDADLSHAPEEVPHMIAGLDVADVVVGSRYIQGGGSDPDWNLSRKLLSTAGNLGIRLVLGLSVRDATSGFKAFRRSALESIDLDRLNLSGYGFQPEVTYRCQKLGMRVLEHPYVFHERTVGESKMSISIIGEAIYRLILLRLRC